MVGMIKSGTSYIFFAPNYPDNIKDLAWKSLEKIQRS